MEEWATAILLLFDRATDLTGHSLVCGDVFGGDCNMDKLSWISGWPEKKGLRISAWESFFFFFFLFAYSTMLFIGWNLRDFSPCWLQPSLNIACFSLLKARVEAFLHMLGLQVIFFLVVFSLLPTVMDPSSVILRFFCFLFWSFSFVLLQYM